MQQWCGVVGTRGTSSSLPCFAICVLCSSLPVALSDWTWSTNVLLTELPSHSRHVKSWEQELQQWCGVVGTRGTSSSLPCFAVCVLCSSLPVALSDWTWSTGVLLTELPSHSRHVKSWEQELQQWCGVVGTRGTSSSLPCCAVCVLCSSLPIALSDWTWSTGVLLTELPSHLSCNNRCLVQEGRIVTCRVLPFVCFVVPRVPKSEFLWRG